MSESLEAKRCPKQLRFSQNFCSSLDTDSFIVEYEYPTPEEDHPTQYLLRDHPDYGRRCRSRRGG